MSLKVGMLIFWISRRYLVLGGTCAMKLLCLAGDPCPIGSNLINVIWLESYLLGMLGKGKGSNP